MSTDLERRNLNKLQMREKRNQEVLDRMPMCPLCNTLEPVFPPIILAGDACTLCNTQFCTQCKTHTSGDETGFTCCNPCYYDVVDKLDRCNNEIYALQDLYQELRNLLNQRRGGTCCFVQDPILAGVRFIPTWEDGVRVLRKGKMRARRVVRRLRRLDTRMQFLAHEIDKLSTFTAPHYIRVGKDWFPT
jgi:hypothetical protein